MHYPSFLRYKCERNSGWDITSSSETALKYHLILEKVNKNLPEQDIRKTFSLQRLKFSVEVAASNIIFVCML